MNSKILFQVSATINAVCIIGHMIMGSQTVHPAIKTISSLEHRVGQRAAQNAWNFMAGSVLVASKDIPCRIIT